MPALGKCWLVGAGPGSPDYLTMRAVNLLKASTAVVYDDLVRPEVLDLAPESSQRHYVGKRGGSRSTAQSEINDLICSLCQQGHQVVRLKGGCPTVFGRVASEIAHLAAAGLPFELVPGVSSALAAAAFAGFPLTDVDVGGAFAVVSGHAAEATDWSAYARVPTLVLLMAARKAAYVAAQLAATGWALGTPVAVVRGAGTEEQRVWRTVLGGLAALMGDGSGWSPCVIIVGEVVALGPLDPRPDPDPAVARP